MVWDLAQGKGLMATYINEPREEDLELRPEDLAVIDEGIESDERSTFQQQQQVRGMHVLLC